MPILRKESSVFPENLFDSGFAIGDRQWRAAFTRSRQEKALARHLKSNEIPFYLPLVPKDNRIRGKKVTSYIPLFSGYVFLCATEEERICSLTSNRICTLIPVQDQARLCQDLKQIERLISTDAPLTVERRISPGERVRITDGAMAGVEGQVIVRRARHRLLVEVEFLQNGVSVEIDDFMLEPIS